MSFRRLRARSGSAELRKRGILIKLQDQPYRILCLLLDSRGEVVTRETLCATLWPEDTFVEFERSLNAAIAKLRQSLGDSAENLRFVETVARRGYRFVAPVEGMDPVTSTSPDRAAEDPVVIARTAPANRHRWSRRITLLVAGGLAVFTVLMIAILFIQGMSHRAREPYTAMRRITSDDGLTRDPAISRDCSLLAYASDRDGSEHLSIWLQQLSGGSTIRLTNTDADDYQPSFSPDGTQLVFRSERDGGGIYLMPSLGGEARLIAKDGRDPSFSPDGKWIAYWVGNLTSDTLNGGEVFVIASSGGLPQRLNTDLKLGYPIWSPDGQHLLVLGARAYIFDKFDWWVFTRDGRSRVQTGAFRLLRDQGFPVVYQGSAYPPLVVQWMGDDLIFSAALGDAVNTWSMHLSRRSWHVQGSPRQLTSGQGFEDHPQALPGQRVVFAGLARSSNLWSLALDANEGKRQSEAPKRLTDKVSLEQFGSITGDGRYLVFTSTRSGKAHVWLKDLSSGQESRLSRTDEQEEHPEISRDGAMIAYWSQPGVTIVRRTRPGVPESQCEKCGCVWDWSADNQTLVYNDLQPIWGIGSFDRTTGKKATVLASAKWPLYQARFSPDGKWLAFGQEVNNSTSRLFITPMHNGIAGTESQWIPIADAGGWCDKPRWSSDGNLIYFISHRDGYRCLWAQHVTPDTKHPYGEPFSVVHFHSARLSMMNISTSFLELEVAKDKLVFNLGERPETSGWQATSRIMTMAAARFPFRTHRLASVTLAVLFLVSMTQLFRDTRDRVDELLHGEEYVASLFDLDEVTFRVTDIEPAAYAAGLQNGDTLLRIGGQPMEGFADFYAVLKRARTGDRLPMQIQRATTAGAMEKNLSIPTKPFAYLGFKATSPAYPFIILLRIALPIFCVALGFWVAAVRVGDVAAWLLLFVMLSLANYISDSRTILGHEDALQPALTAFSMTLFNLAPVALPLFAIVFPERLALDRRFPWIKWLVVGPLLALAIPFGIADALLLHHRGVFWTVLEPLTIPFRVLRVLAAAIFFGALIYKTATAVNRDARRRLLLLDAGAAASFLPLVIYTIVSVVQGRTSPGWVIFLMAALLIFPLTMAYVIVVHRAMDVRVVVRQGLQYLLATRSIGALQIAISIAIIVTAATMTASMSLLQRVGFISLGFVLLAGMRGFALRLRGG